MKVDIDLTDDADDLGGPSSKRQRTVWYGGDVVIVEQHPAGGATVQAEAADTDVDVLLVERDGEAAAQLQQDEEAAGLPGDDEDVRLVGQSGEVHGAFLQSYNCCGCLEDMISNHHPGIRWPPAQCHRPGRKANVLTGVQNESQPLSNLPICAGTAVEQ